MSDLMIGDRSGSVVFRNGKGNKQRSVPLPLLARRALAAYLETRPPMATTKVFVGERGPLTDRGFRALCDKYSAICGRQDTSPSACGTRWPINSWPTTLAIWYPSPKSSGTRT